MRSDNERRRVLVLEARLSDVLADLVARSGGKPVRVPAVVEVESPPDEVAGALRALCGTGVDVAVFMTGVGAARLHTQASALGLGDAYLEALTRLPVVVRGPKPTAVLHRWGIRPSFSASSPHTTAEVCRLLDSLPLDGQRVFLQHYGRINQELRGYLRTRGAVSVDALPYRWALPSDPAPLRDAVHDLIGARYDAVLVTSQPQVIHLFEVADGAGVAGSLRRALNSHVTVAAIGPTARASLLRHGVQVNVEPLQPKMAPLVRALDAHLRGGASAQPRPAAPATGTR